MLIFKALHILSMITVVTMEVGAEFLYAFAVARRDVRALAIVHRMLEQARLGQIAIAVFVSGIVFGLLTALTGGFDLKAFGSSILRRQPRRGIERSIRLHAKPGLA